MARDPIESMHWASQATLIAALVMLAGALVAFAAKAHAIALVFLVLMLVCAMASSGFAVVFRNRAQAAARAARAARAQQAARPPRRTTR
jgi:choline-glycine betaine transporter